jgi:2-polyprenyl-6-methoxyphenol hydroxylase-like FAD-dependent oxidoreductase
VEHRTRIASRQDEWGVRAVLERGGERIACSAAYLCGCDGARSRVRESLKLDFSGGTYDHLYYVADVKVAGPDNRDLIGHLGANTFALMLPVRSSGMQRLIGIMPPRRAKPSRTRLRRHAPGAGTRCSASASGR